MTHSQTAAGTPVIEMNAQEHRSFLEHEVRARLGISLAEFEERYESGTLDDSDPDVGMLAVLVGLGQGSHPLAAA